MQLFVGNVLNDGSNVDLKEFLNLAMRQTGLCTTDEDPITECRRSEKFCFVVFRSVEDCTAGLNLNGIPFMNALLKIDRPAKYAGPRTAARTWQQLTGQAAPEGQLVTAASAADPATKGYRELFVGNTPPDTTSASLAEFIGGALQRMGHARPEGKDSPVLQVRINDKFCFVELRSVEEAANVLNLNGIPYSGQ